MLKKLTIIHKLNLSFAAIVLSVLSLVTFSYFSISSLENIFTLYRDQARQGIVLGDLVQSLGEARNHVLKYRLNADKLHEEAVERLIGDLEKQTSEAEEYLKNQDVIEQLKQVYSDAEQYGEYFKKVAHQQDLRNQVVEKYTEESQKIRKSLTEIMFSANADGDATAAYYAGLAQQHYMLARYYTQSYLLTNMQEDADRVFKEIKSAHDVLTTLIPELQNPKRLQLANYAQSAIASFKGDFEEIISIIEMRNKYNKEGLDVLGPKILAGYRSLHEAATGKQVELGPQGAAKMTETITVSLIVGIIIAIVSAVISFFLGRFIAKNLDMIIEQMKRLSEGDKSFEIVGRERLDEIGHMAGALDIFRSNMIERERLEAEAKKEQEAQLQKAEKTMKSVAAFEGVIEKITSGLNGSSTTLEGLATQLSSAMEETTHQSSSVAAASEQMSANVSTVAAASEELSSSIQEISKNISQTADMVKECTSSAEVSRESLEILQRTVDEIDSVVQSINDVAEQTNLLALNATIEAARAGDAGKGFAVVANEVKSLANETHKMTEEIANKVKGIKDSAYETIKSVSSIIKQITSVDEKTSSIAAAIEEQNSSTLEISRNAQQASSATNEVSKSIVDVQKAANESAESTVQLQHSAEDLHGQAGGLREAVDGFLNDVRAA